MFVEKAAASTARLIKKANENETSSFEVLRFGLIHIYNALFIVILSFSLGLIFDYVGEIAITIILFVFVRLISGGYHLRESDLCVLVSVALILIMASIKTYDFIYPMSVISLLIFIIRAPNNIESHSSFVKGKLWIKIICSLIIICNIIWIDSYVVSNVFFVQSLTLLERKKE